MSEVLSIKTVSNEEVIATIVEDNEDHYVLNKARALVMQQAPDGSVSLGMLPFMVGANNPEYATESDIILYKKDIMGMAVKTPEPLIRGYLKSVSSIELI